MAKIGDIVRFLNSVGGGRVTKIKDNIAYVEDEDGFETPVLLRECVVVGQAWEKPAPTAEHTAVAVKQPAAVTKEVVAAAVPVVDEMPIEETPEGEKLNVVLGYEAHDLKQLSATSFDTYLVNDSNYFLYFSYLTRSDDSNEWTTRYAGIVEPNIQVFIGEVGREDLPGMERVAIQYIAFKRDKGFGLKRPASVELRVDTTKFAKLHCFKENMYFDVPVIAFEIVKDDVPHKVKPIDGERIETALRSKKDVPAPRKRVVKRRSKQDRRGDVIVVDLHIAELVDSTRGLSNADMLNLQVDEFSRVMDENRKNKGQKIVFIHGKGEGVLRNAIMKELNHRYKGNDVQDASFREYGYGATQVTIR